MYCKNQKHRYNEGMEQNAPFDGRKPNPERKQTMSYSEFIAAFAAAANLSRQEAEAQWTGYSRELPNAERLAIEARGAESGSEMGAEFRTAFPE